MADPEDTAREARRVAAVDVEAHGVYWAMDGSGIDSDVTTIRNALLAAEKRGAEAERKRLLDAIEEAVPLPYAPGSSTSREAAQSARERAATNRSRVLRYIRERGDRGATAEEVGLALCLPHQSYSARVSELANRYREIVLTDRTRPTSSGRPAGVYVATRALHCRRCGRELWTADDCGAGGGPCGPWEYVAREVE